VLTGRREDRLLFDHQIRLAKQFGYEDASFTLAVEQFMQRYYRTVMFVSLTERAAAAALPRGDPVLERRAARAAHAALPRARRVPRGNLARRVRAHPSALLELFVVLQNNPQLRGVRAETIRLVSRHLWLIDEEFRQNPRNHRLFLRCCARRPASRTNCAA
jgi:[protein-PII] uridylyltransferase